MTANAGCDNPRRRLFQDRRQSLLALEERHSGGRHAIEFKQVKGEIDERAAPAIGRSLYPFEGRYAVSIDAPELAINVGGSDRVFCESGCGLRIFFRPIQPGADE